MMARNSTELADMLNYRLREHLGAGVDYRATLMPNELAIHVEMLQPEYLRGLTFTFRENEPLPEPIRRAEQLIHTPLLEPNARYIQFRPLIETTPWATNGTILQTYDIETRRTEAPMATIGRTRTEADEIRYQQLFARDRAGAIFNPDGQDYRDWNRLIGMNPYVPTPGVRTREQEARLVELHSMYSGDNAIMMSGAQLAERARLMAMRAYDSLAPAITVRTAEQEARWMELGDMTRPWTAAEITENDSLSRLAAHPHPISPRTYVRVWRDGGMWYVTVRVGRDNRDLPSIAVIKSLINPADKHYLPSRQGRRLATIRILRNSLEAGLPAQSLHDALRAWVMATENQVTEAESSMPANGIDPATAQLLRAQPATLEVGGRVFRLVPAHEIDVRPLITRVRQRTIANARVETDAMRERARTDARVLTTEAERSARRLREEAEATARRMGARAPDWVRDSGRPHYYDSSYWHIQLKVNCFMRDIRFLIRDWGVILHWKPLVIPNRPLEWYAEEHHKCPLWFRIGEEGGYDKNSISSADWDTPHISSFMCMDLYNKPTRVRFMEDVLNLEVAITRGMQVVNFNSPLSRNVDNYFPAIREQFPPIAAKVMKNEIVIQPGQVRGDDGLYRMRTIAEWKVINPTITWDSQETLAEENTGTFNVDNPVPTLSVALPEAEAIMAEAERITGE